MNKSAQEQVPDGLGLADEGLVRWVSEVRRSVGPSCREAGAQRLRASAQARTASRPRGPELPLVQNLRIDHGLAVRLYRPTLDLRPTVLYLHGGGFVMGDLESHDGTCRRLARIADVTVLAVDYRLAPEHPVQRRSRTPSAPLFGPVSIFRNWAATLRPASRWPVTAQAVPSRCWRPCACTQAA